MKKRIYPLLLPLLLLTACSSMPKKEAALHVSAVKTESALQLKRGDREFLWGSHEAALGLYRKALKSASSVDWLEGTVRSLVQISRALDQLGRREEAYRYAEAAGEMQKAAASRPLEILTLNRLAEWHYRGEEFDRALGLLDQALQKGTDGPAREAGETWRLKAAVHKRQRDYEKGLFAVGEALALDEKGLFLAELASDYYIQASLLSLSGRYAEAVASMETALEKDKIIENSPGIAQDLYGLGRIHGKNGREDLAREFYRRAALAYSGAGGQVPSSLGEILEGETLWLPQIDGP